MKSGLSQAHDIISRGCVVGANQRPMPQEQGSMKLSSAMGDNRTTWERRRKPTDLQALTCLSNDSMMASFWRICARRYSRLLWSGGSTCAGPASSSGSVTVSMSGPGFGSDLSKTSVSGSTAVGDEEIGGEDIVADGGTHGKKERCMEIETVRGSDWVASVTKAQRGVDVKREV